LGRSARAYAEANFECDSILNKVFAAMERDVPVPKEIVARDLAR
jgi:hypothetical protein